MPEPDAESTSHRFKDPEDCLRVAASQKLDRILITRHETVLYLRCCHTKTAQQVGSYLLHPQKGVRPTLPSECRSSACGENAQHLVTRIYKRHLLTMNPILQDRLFQIGQLTSFAHSQQQIIVLRAQKC